MQRNNDFVLAPRQPVRRPMLLFIRTCSPFSALGVTKSVSKQDKLAEINDVSL